MQSSPASHNFLPLCSSILLSTLFSDTLCSAFSVRDHVLHPHKTMGKIIILYILIFKI
jgi:hypothetical protein